MADEKVDDGKFLGFAGALTNYKQRDPAGKDVFRKVFNEHPKVVSLFGLRPSAQEDAALETLAEKAFKPATEAPLDSYGDFMTGVSAGALAGAGIGALNAPKGGRIKESIKGAGYGTAAGLGIVALGRLLPRLQEAWSDKKEIRVWAQNH